MRGSRALAVLVVLAVLTALAPRWLLLLGPLLFGVPHIAGDLRCLVLRSPFRVPRAVILAVTLPLLLLVVLRAARAAGLLDASSIPATLEVGLGVLAIVGAAVATPSRARRRLVVWPCVVIVTILAMHSPQMATLVLGHLHNAIAIAFLCYFTATSWSSSQRVRFCFLAALAAVVLASTPLVAFAKDALLDRALPRGFGFDELSASLAPGVSADLAARLVLVFAFAQAAHYFAWVYAIPASMTEAPAPQSLRRLLAAWRDAFSPRGFALVVALTLAVPLAGLVAPLAARTSYLSLVFFHGWLELGIATYLFLRSPLPTKTHA